MSGASGSGSRRAFLRRGALVTCAVLALGAAGALPAAAATAAPAPIVAGAPGPGCPAPAYPTVIAAVAAAPSGATINVCAGTYPGTVEVTRPITLRGAMAGRDARAGRTAAAAESVIDAGGGPGVRIAAGVSGVTVDGFTIRDAGTDAVAAAGVDASGGGSGFTIADNIITDTSNGVALSSDGAVPSRISHNRFVANNRTGGAGGAGVLVCCGPGNDLLIIENSFRGHTSAAVNTAGDPARPSSKLRIDLNSSIDDSTFAVVMNADAPTINRNTVRRGPPGASPPVVGNAIFLAGNTIGAEATMNTIEGGASAGIRISNEFGPGNTGFVVSGNTVTARQNGIRLTGQVSGTVTDNTVSASTAVGILLDADNNGVLVSHSLVGLSGVLDCKDLSAGTATAGTANTWTANIATGGAPAGICAPA
ncbi:right-handed parallel beta-helix repeat-containing protein [Pseudonocardia sp. GCM10023141]|uniref:right-handed parallel beta-helix repeat-containing protein n=1 Tax=Pseudonocardia sp. GCM10023141 TaxID=3252653 RepID=UPI0036064F69